MQPADKDDIDNAHRLNALNNSESGYETAEKKELQQCMQNWLLEYLEEVST